jgi:hypothetical protein
MRLRAAEDCIEAPLSHKEPCTGDLSTSRCLRLPDGRPRQESSTVELGAIVETDASGFAKSAA